MTTARRKARAVGPVMPAPAEDDALVELLRDRRARVWHNRDAYRRFMESHGWHLPIRDRLGPADGKWATGAPPTERREYAVEAWARENGITLPPTVYFPDWHELDRRRLERMGLLEPRRLIAEELNQERTTTHAR